MAASEKIASGIFRRAGGPERRRAAGTLPGVLPVSTRVEFGSHVLYPARGKSGPDAAGWLRPVASTARNSAVAGGFRCVYSPLSYTPLHDLVKVDRCLSCHRHG